MRVSRTAVHPVVQGGVTKRRRAPGQNPFPKEMGLVRESSEFLTTDDTDLMRVSRTAVHPVVKGGVTKRRRGPLTGTLSKEMGLVRESSEFLTTDLTDLMRASRTAVHPVVRWRNEAAANAPDRNPFPSP
jgi:hypothetical protein